MAKTKNKSEENGNEAINWFAEFRGLAAMLLAVVAFHSFIAKPFYIPSESMMPSLLKGDRLVVSKYPYGWSWSSISFHLAPRGDWRIWADTPEYGDIVIPVHPERDEDYIKRVVALPGDTIAVQSGQIILNGEPVVQEVEPAIEVPVDLSSPCPESDYPGMRVRNEAGEPICEMPVLRETLPNGASYLVIDHREQTLDNFGPVVIPQDHVFVMGDNRDHSADSRATVSAQGLGGAVPLSNIGGRAEFITFSLDGTTNWNPISWFTSLRGSRAWSTLRPALEETSPQTASPANSGE